MSLHLFDSLFFKLKSQGGKLDTYSFIQLCLVRLCKSVKLEVRAGIGLIYQHCGSVISSKAVAFIRNEARDMRADLFAAKDAVNKRVIKDLLYFVFDNRRRNKVP